MENSVEGISLYIPENESFHSLLTGSDEELHSQMAREHRAKALQRIREKRSEMREEELKEYELEFLQSQEARDKWISHLKNKRELELRDSVARVTVVRALHDNPDIFAKNGRANIESAWREIVPDGMLRTSGLSGALGNSVLNLGPSDSADFDDEYAVEVTCPSDSAVKSSQVAEVLGVVESTPTPVTAAFLQRTLTDIVRKHMAAGRRLPSLQPQPVGMLSKYIQHRVATNERPEGLATERDGPALVPLASPPVMAPRLSLSPEKATDFPSPGLIESLLLVGPNKTEIDALLHRISDEITSHEATSAAVDNNAAIDSSGLGLATPGRARSISNSSTGVVTAITKQTRYISPEIIFVTSQDPDVETAALSSFCFPSGVETTISVTPCNPAMMGILPGPFSRSAKSIGKKVSLNALPSTSSVGGPSGSQSPLQPSSSPLSTTGGGACTRSVFMLTNHHNSQYGICLSVPRVIMTTVKDKAFAIKTFYSVCVITPYPFFAFFFQALAEFINMKGLLLDSSGVVGKQEPGDPIKAELRQLESFAMKLLRQIVPKPGKTLDFSVTVNMAHRDVQLKRLALQDHSEEACIGTLLWALPILLKSIPLDQLLLVLGCALTEMKVVVRSANLEVLSACVLALVQLLRPLRWAGPVISILPAMMHDIIDSPVPIFIGVEATPRSFKMTNGLIVVDPMQKLIHMHPTDVVSSHTLCLPQASKLQQTLKPLVDNILKLSRKLRKLKRRSSNSALGEATQGRRLVSSRGSAMSPVESESEGDSDNPDPPKESKDHVSADRMAQLPPRYEATEDIAGDNIASSPLLTAAITAFADAVRDHLQKMVNTAVQISWEKKNQRLQAQADLLNAPKERTLDRSNSDISIASLSEMSTFSQNLPKPETASTDVFPRLTIGSSAFSFIGMFSKTQLFCEYCERHSCSNKTINDIVTQSALQTDEGKDSAQDVASSAAAATSGDPASQYDPLVMLFTIMLTGTSPVNEIKLASLQATFDSLYSDCKHIEDRDRVAAVWACEETERPAGEGSDTSQRKFPAVFPCDEAVGFLDEGMLWCNGRCNGLANTPSCTGICIDIWEARVQNLKKLKRAMDIVRHDSTILKPGTTVRTESGDKVCIPSSVKLSNGRRLNVKLVRGIQPRKHPKETPSQYLHRVSLVTGRDREAVAADGEIIKAIFGSSDSPLCDDEYDDSPTLLSDPKDVLLQTHSIQYAEHTKLQARDSKNRKTKALRSIIFARQNKKKRRLYLRRMHAAHVVCRFFSKAKQYRLDMVWNYAATIVQKHIRGMIVRFNMDLIIASLIARKRDVALLAKKQKLARGVLKNWLQKSFDNKRGPRHLDDDKIATAVSAEKSGHSEVEDAIVEESMDGRPAEGSTSFNTLKVFDYVSETEGSQSHRDRAQSEDWIHIADPLSPRLRRSQTYQTTASNGGASVGGGLLGGLIPAKTVDAAEDPAIKPLNSRGSFSIREALRRREALLSESDATDPTQPILEMQLSSGTAESGTLYSPARLTDSPSVFTTDNHSFGPEHGGTTGLAGSSSRSAIAKRQLVNSSSSGSDRKLGAAELDSIMEESSGPRGHRRNQQSGSTISADSVSEDLKDSPLCIKNLGTAGQELLNHVQQQCIVDMCSILRGGIQVLKHGRSGKPKFRTLSCDDTLSTLYWRDAGHVVHDDRSMNSLEAGANNFALPDMSPFTSGFADHSSTRKSVSRRRSSFSVFSKLDSRREVVIRDVVEVRDDMTTDVMKRSIAKKYVDETRLPSLVISIILKDRTLDFEIEEVHWGRVYMALQILVDFFQVRLRRQAD